MTPLSGISEIVGTEVRWRRARKKWTVESLAARCAEVGAPHLTPAALYALESGRKDATGRRRRLVTVDELLVLAHVLGLNPAALFAPADVADEEPFQLTPGFITTAGAVRLWFTATVARALGKGSA